MTIRVDDDVTPDPSEEPGFALVSTDEADGAEEAEVIEDLDEADDDEQEELDEPEDHDEPELDEPELDEPELDEPEDHDEADDDEPQEAESPVEGSTSDLDELLDELLADDDTGDNDTADEELEESSVSPTQPVPSSNAVVVVPDQVEERDRSWTLAELRSVLAPALAALAVLGALGFAVSFLRGGQEVVRREFVYTLDESVPDSFLREDRRLLTQIATLESDAVLTPVAARFGLDVDDLRDKIDIETVDLSEVLRLDVRDRDRDRALAISQAVIDEYLVVTTTPLPSESSEALLAERSVVVADLAEADESLLALQTTQRTDARLLTEEESLDRKIDLTGEQINRLQGLLDTSLVSTLAVAREAALEAELAAAETELTDLEAGLADVRAQRVALAEQSASEAPITREIDRLEAELATIDAELAQRELGPLVASPVRVLAEPTFHPISAARAGLRGLAIGLLIGLPVAAVLAARSRSRQLWLG